MKLDLAILDGLGLMCMVSVVAMVMVMVGKCYLRILHTRHQIHGLTP